MASTPVIADTGFWIALLNESDAHHTRAVEVLRTLESGDILSTDRRDFNAYRWKSRKPFNNLLLPG
ncbi:MAG: hypothetical protein ACLGII_13205 [Gammaproteobacteria bacterium]|jgi:predicted nucleic acid-binding protein